MDLSKEKIMAKACGELPGKFFSFICFFLRDFKTAAVICALLAILAGFWGPFNSLLIKEVIDLLPQTQHGEISVLFLPASLIVINFIIFDNFTWRGTMYIRSKYVPIIINRMVSKCMDHILKQPDEFFQNNLTGKLAKQITNLSDGAEALFSSISLNFLRGASLLIAAMVTAYFANPVFCLILVIWFVLFAWGSIFMSKKLVHLSDAQALAESKVVGELVDTVSNQSNVRIFSNRAFESTRIAPYLKRQQHTYGSKYFYFMIMHSIQGGMIAIMMGFTIYFLIKLHAQDLVTAGDFALILGLAMETGHMMWFTMSHIDEYNKVLGKCKQSLSSLTKPLSIKDKVNAVELKCPRGRIRFSKVKFQYQDSQVLFHNKCIDINAGEKVGLVGHSGAGKSTFVNLIMRFYDVTDGSILIDGTDVRDVTQESLRKNIAMIPQDPVLFQRSLMENISYGNTKVGADQVIDAAKKAHAHEFISKLPQGYDALVGERGVKLSGGQRQRIAIARAILKGAPILILDEATSQLDSISEAMIQESLWELMQGKTTIVIAHRLSTLLKMDRILVFRDGMIVEDGPHRELLLKSKLYKELWDAQVGGFLGDRTSH